MRFVIIPVRPNLDVVCGRPSLPLELYLLWWASWLVWRAAAMDVTFRTGNHDSDGMRQMCYCRWSSPLCRRYSFHRVPLPTMRNMHAIESNCILQLTREYFLCLILWQQPSFTLIRTEWRLIFFSAPQFDSWQHRVWQQQQQRQQFDIRYDIWRLYQSLIYEFRRKKEIMPTLSTTDAHSSLRISIYFSTFIILFNPKYNNYFCCYLHVTMGSNFKPTNTWIQTKIRRKKKQRLHRLTR